MALTETQIKKALSLPPDVMVEACMKKIKLGQLSWDEMAMLCGLRETTDVESVAKEILSTYPELLEENQ